MDATPERALRAVQIIKATRAASEVVRHNPLAPAETTLNCDSVVSVDVESLDSSCEVMPDEGYIVTLEGCEMDNGETFDAELVVSTPDIESGDIAAANSVVDPTRVLAVAPMWMASAQIITDTGTKITTCGTLDRNVFQSHEDYRLTIESTDGAFARYAVASTGRMGNGQVIGRTDRIQLEASHPAEEVVDLSVRTRTEQVGTIASGGVAELVQDGGENLYFRPRLTQQERVLWSPHRSIRRALDISEL